jgi:hypothetical protein
VDITPSKKRQFKFKNMKLYLVKIICQMPYPVEKNYKMEASGFGTAIGRAIKLFRKEKDHKKIKEITIKATYVSTTKTIHAEMD